MKNVSKLHKLKFSGLYEAASVYGATLVYGIEKPRSWVGFQYPESTVYMYSKVFVWQFHTMNINQGWSHDSLTYANALHHLKPCILVLFTSMRMYIPTYTSQEYCLHHNITTHILGFQYLVMSSSLVTYKPSHHNSDSMFFLQFGSVFLCLQNSHHSVNKFDRLRLAPYLDVIIVFLVM